MRTSTPRTRTAVAGLAAAGVVGSLGLAAAAPATASDPGESTITGSKKPGTATSTWSGSIAYPGADLADAVGATDTHTLTVKAPGKKKKAKKYFKKYSAVLDVTIAWSGVYNDLDGMVMVANSDVIGNAAVGQGGGVYNNDAADLSVSNSRFSVNTSEDGAGIFNELAGDVVINNTTFTANAASGDGGAIYNDDGNVDS